jgi:hypothetical protein
MVDTLDSKSGVSNDVPVQIRFAVPRSIKKTLFGESFSLFVDVYRYG